MDHHERRKEPRFQAHRPVRIILPDGTKLDANTQDLSAGGLGALCEHSLPAGIQLTLEISVDSTEQPLTLWSHVQHCSNTPQQNGFSLGLRHRNPPPPYLGLLRSVRLRRWHQHNQ